MKPFMIHAKCNMTFCEILHSDTKIKYVILYIQGSDIVVLQLFYDKKFQVFRIEIIHDENITSYAFKNGVETSKIKFNI